MLALLYSKRGYGHITAQLNLNEYYNFIYRVLLLVG